MNRRMGLALLCLGLCGYYVGCSKIKGTFSDLFVLDSEATIAPGSVTITSIVAVRKAKGEVESFTFDFVSCTDANGAPVSPTSDTVVAQSGGPGPNSRGGSITRKVTFPAEDRTRTTPLNVRPLTVTFVAHSNCRTLEGGVETNDPLTETGKVTIPK